VGTLKELRGSISGSDSSLESLFLQLTSGPNGNGNTYQTSPDTSP